MENDTLEGLIASMEHEPRSFVDDDDVLRTSTINRHAASCKKCRAERILAALRDDLQDLEDTANEISVNAEGRAYRNALRVCVSRVRKRLVRHTAVADQTGAGKGTK